MTDTQKDIFRFLEYITEGMDNAGDYIVAVKSHTQHAFPCVDRSEIDGTVSAYFDKKEMKGGSDG